MRIKSRKHVSLWVLLAILLSATPAFAYLDPGAGSMVLQGVLAGIAAVSVYCGLFWGRIKAFFAGKKSADQESEIDAE